MFTYTSIIAGSLNSPFIMYAKFIEISNFMVSFLLTVEIIQLLITVMD